MENQSSRQRVATDRVSLVRGHRRGRAALLISVSTLGIAWLGCHAATSQTPGEQASVAPTRPTVSATASGSASTSEVASRLEVSVPRWMEENTVPAVAVGIVENGDVAFRRVFGERYPGAPANESTIFNVASLTKPIVTIVALKLVATGQFDLDEPLAPYWVDARVRNDPRHRKLTARLVLSHQTGFPNWGDREHLPFESDPGTSYGYSGAGFEYLKEALERKFGRTLEELSERLLFQPLGMAATRYTWDEELHEPRFARWFDSAGAPYEAKWKHTDARAADDLLTTIGDYTAFARDVARRDGLPAELFSEMSTLHTPVNARVGSGLGWRVVPNLANGEFALVHGGGDPGVRTRVVVLPNSQRAVVVFTNGDRGDVVLYRIIRDVLDVGHEIMDALELVPVPDDLSRVVAIDETELKNYAGTFRDDDTVEIQRHENRLRLRVKEPLGQRVYLHPLGSDRFLAEGEGFEVVFDRDAAGMVIGFTAYEGEQEAFGYTRVGD